MTQRLILQWCGLIRAREFGRHTRYVITTLPVLDDEMAALALERMRIDEKEGAVKWLQPADDLKIAWQIASASGKMVVGVRTDKRVEADIDIDGHHRRQS